MTLDLFNGLVGVLSGPCDWTEDDARCVSPYGSHRWPAARHQRSYERQRYDEQ